MKLSEIKEQFKEKEGRELTASDIRTEIVDGEVFIFIYYGEWIAQLEIESNTEFLMAG